MNRNQAWKDCLNVRDLGGLRTRPGARTRFNSLFRADNLDRLSRAGVESMQAVGIRTIIDLRHERERLSDSPVRLSEPFNYVPVPLEDEGDLQFWQRWLDYNCTPLYYEAFLERCSRRVAEVFSAIAEAAAGGVVFHCMSGRDRTGLVAMLLLHLVECEHDEIVSDYELSSVNLSAYVSARETEHIASLLADHDTSCNDVLRSLLNKLDVENYLLKAGVPERQIANIKKRLIDEPGS
ncbi:MAG TPA: tyrosine-protein phosphatase [Chroococcales cyanobacterium]